MADGAPVVASLPMSGSSGVPCPVRLPPGYAFPAVAASSGALFVQIPIRLSHACTMRQRPSDCGGRKMDRSPRLGAEFLHGSAATTVATSPGGGSTLEAQTPDISIHRKEINSCPGHPLAACS